jgi:hypothetical protein
MKNKISPVGLKGREVTDRMKQLMGITTINEDRKPSVVELTKMGPDGNVYGIVRENHEYYIKVAAKKENIVAEDFRYIGGLQNKKNEAYPSYAKAIKHLNLKFNSLNEAYGRDEDYNVFENDNLLNENMSFGFKNEGNLEGHAQSECCHSPIHEGKCSSCGNEINENECMEEDALNEIEQAVDDMLENEDMDLTELEEAIDKMLETSDVKKKSKKN